MTLKVILFFISILILSIHIDGINALPEKNPVNDPPGVNKTLDGKFIEVATKVPGFGGMFKDGDVLKVYLVNQALKHEAEAGIVSVFGKGRIPKGGIQVLEGQYSFSQLKKWHNSLANIFDIPGVIFTDVDDTSNRLKIGVESPDSFGAVEKYLINQGIPKSAFLIEKSEPVVYATTLRDRIRPIQGGIEIEYIKMPYYYICTLGFNGIRSGVNGFVVNSHCTEVQGKADGTSYYQANYAFPENHIGSEIADPSFFDNGSGCPYYRPSVCRWSDAAFASRADGVPANIGFISRTDSVNTGSLNIYGNFRIVSEGSSIVGDSVNKVGRTTGRTQGLVTDVCVDTSVSGENYVQLCQTFVNAGVGSGDSGSPVFNISNNPELYDVELLGILWGGNLNGTLFVYSPINKIEDELGDIKTTVYDYNHTLTMSPGGSFDSVTDTVASTTGNFYGARATFDWVRPNGSSARTMEVFLPISNQYEDINTDIDMEGIWNITFIEYDISNNQLINGNNPSMASFTATNNPAFGPMGSVLILFSAGIFYLILRKEYFEKDIH